MGFASWAFHQITDKHYTPPTDREAREYAEGSLERFVRRFGGALNFSGRSVLDVGCGNGVLCIEAARRGATAVVGIDLDVSAARMLLQERGQDVTERVVFVEGDGTLDALAARRFDVVVSKDSFEHYDDPEAFIHSVSATIVPGGELIIASGRCGKARGAGTSTS